MVETKAQRSGLCENTSNGGDIFGWYFKVFFFFPAHICNPVQTNPCQTVTVAYNSSSRALSPPAFVSTCMHIHTPIHVVKDKVNREKRVCFLKPEWEGYL